jgi:hypothetical protein
MKRDIEWTLAIKSARQPTETSVCTSRFGTAGSPGIKFDIIFLFDKP